MRKAGQDATEEFMVLHHASGFTLSLLCSLSVSLPAFVSGFQSPLSVRYIFFLSIPAVVLAQYGPKLQIGTVDTKKPTAAPGAYFSSLFKKILF